MNNLINNNKYFCYIHIPFCTSKCKYCQFASFWNQDLLKIDIYVKYLINEINKNKIDFKELKSIYFGWWTPSTLSINQLWKIINTLKNKYNFSNDIEINIEATPNTITIENLIWWSKLWINRLSIWVQTLNNDSLIEIWRWNKWDIINSLNNIKSLNKIDLYDKNIIDNISIDFIIWLPHVIKWEIKENIEFILQKFNFIKHISVYMLEDYYYPENWSWLSVDEDNYLDEYIEIKNVLNFNWFNSYEISNFSKKWYECKHNKAYWNHSNILAFWLWAHGFIDGKRYSNIDNFRWYYTWIKKNIEPLLKEDYFLEMLMFQLRTSWINNEIYSKLNMDKINSLINDWFLIKTNKKLILSNKGILVIDYILKEII